MIIYIGCIAARRMAARIRCEWILSDASRRAPSSPRPAQLQGTGPLSGKTPWDVATTEVRQVYDNELFMQVANGEEAKVLALLRVSRTVPAYIRVYMPLEIEGLATFSEPCVTWTGLGRIDALGAKPEALHNKLTFFVVFLPSIRPACEQTSRMGVLARTPLFTGRRARETPASAPSSWRTERNWTTATAKVSKPWLAAPVTTTRVDSRAFAL